MVFDVAALLNSLKPNPTPAPPPSTFNPIPGPQIPHAPRVPKAVLPSTTAPGPLNLDIDSLLAAYKASPVGSRAQNFLQNASINWDNVGNLGKLPSESGGAPGPSVLSRIIDILSRGQYASAEFARQLVEAPTPGESPLQQASDVFTGAIKGLAGKEKTSYGDVLREMEYNAANKGNGGVALPDFLNPASGMRSEDFTGAGNAVKQFSPTAPVGTGTNLANAGLGLAGDIFLDPTSYIGLGEVKAGLRGLGKGAIAAGLENPATTRLARIGVKESLPEASGALSIAPTGGAELQPGGSIGNLLGGKLNLNIKAPEIADNGFPAPTPVASPSVSLPPLPKITPQALNKSVAMGSVPQLTERQIRGAVLKQTAGMKNPEIRKLIDRIQAPLEEKVVPPGIRWASRQELIDTLINIQKSSGVESLQKTGQGFEPKWQEFKRATASHLGMDAQDSIPYQLNTAKKWLDSGKIDESTYNSWVQRISPTAPPQDLAKALQPKAISAATRQVAEQTGAKTAAENYIGSTLSKGNTFDVAGKMNPARQANFFQNHLLGGNSGAAAKILKSEGVNKPFAGRFTQARFASAYRMLKQAEEIFASRGYEPIWKDGSHLRLSDVIDAVGGPGKISKELFTQLMDAFKSGDITKIQNPEIRNAIGNLQGVDAEKTEILGTPIVNQVTGGPAAVAEQVLSQPKYEAWKKQQGRLAAKTNLHMAMMSPAGQKVVSDTVKAIFKAQETPLQQAVRRQGSAIQKYITSTTEGGKFVGSNVRWSPIARSQGNALAKQLGTGSLTKLGKVIGPENKALEFLGGRFATWFGQKDVRPIALNFIASAMNNAAIRANMWNKAIKEFSEADRLLAFKAAQGIPGTTISPELQPLVAQFQKSIEDLYKTSGLSDEAQKASSAAMRSGLLLQDINKQLASVRSDFKFSTAEKAFHPADPSNVMNFSKGTDWMNSWKAYEAKDPVDFMMRLQSATEQVMAQYAYMDELSARFGSLFKSGVFNTPVGHVGPKFSQKTGRQLKGLDVTGIGRLSGVYFPKDVADQVTRSLKTWNQVYDPKSPLIKFLDSAVSAWKAGVTIYAPSHHIRNMVGDTFLSWLGGVNNPRVFQKAAKVLWSQKDRYASGLIPEEMMAKDAVRLSLTRPGDVVATTKSGLPLTAEQVYIAAHRNGLLSSAKYLEDIYGNSILGNMKPLGGKLSHTARMATEVQEHYARLAHFIDVLQKSSPRSAQDLPRAFSDAASQVRKWHPDGLDLTHFERSTMRRIFPFYSWTRKAIPILIEGALEKPGKVTAYNKAMFAAQQGMGIQSESAANPFPTDQLFPAWLMAKGVGPLLGSSGDYTIVNPSTPFNDVVSQFTGVPNQPSDVVKDFASGLMGMATPVAKIPFELGTGSTTLGTPVYSDFNRYATEQIPIASDASRFFNMGIFGPTNRASQQTPMGGSLNQPGLLNFLFALGITPTAPYIKQAQFEERARAKAAAGG